LPIRFGTDGFTSDAGLPVNLQKQCKINLDDEAGNANTNGDKIDWVLEGLESSLPFNTAV
jgi:hypothetical protein